VILTPESTRNVLEFSDYLAEEIDRLALRPQVFLPRRGDVLIWHGSLLHEGTKVVDLSQTRRSFVTHFTSRRSCPPHINAVDVFARPVTPGLELPSWRR